MDAGSEQRALELIDRVRLRPPAFKDAQILMPNSPYMQLAQLDQRSVAIEYNDRMNKKYAVKWHELPAKEVGPMYDDE